MTNEQILAFIRETFAQPEGFIPLHAPHFGGNEKQYVLETIESTYVSSVGAFVNRFEEMMREITGARHAVAIVNGTCALHLALVLADVSPGNEVITQPLTFVATANAIRHAGAVPVFVDVDRDTLGMSPEALEAWLEENTVFNGEGHCINRQTRRRVKAVVPMHTFGFPARIDAIREICDRYDLRLVEDAAESLGSYAGEEHTGTIGELGVFSFNGNKTVTSGGGGAIVTNYAELAQRAKHLSTTAKQPHAWAYAHDEVGYNYRMPNLNAALACAQLEQLPAFLENKRALADAYAGFFAGSDIEVVREREGDVANYWLNTLILPSAEAKEAFLTYSNDNGVMTRPIWQLMTRLPMYAESPRGPLPHAEWLEARVVNVPSSYRVVSNTKAQRHEDAQKTL